MNKDSLIGAMAIGREIDKFPFLRVLKNNVKYSLVREMQENLNKNKLKVDLSDVSIKG